MEIITFLLFFFLLESLCHVTPLADEELRTLDFLLVLRVMRLVKIFGSIKRYNCLQFLLLNSEYQSSFCLKVERSLDFREILLGWAMSGTEDNAKTSGGRGRILTDNPAADGSRHRSPSWNSLHDPLGMQIILGQSANAHIWLVCRLLCESLRLRSV